MLPRGSRRSLWGWLALLVLLLLGAAMAAAEEKDAPPPPGVCTCVRVSAHSLARSHCLYLCLSAPVDWSKTASGHGKVKLNRNSKWVQYVVGGDVFYIKDDNWSTRRDDPVRSHAFYLLLLGPGLQASPRRAWLCSTVAHGVSRATDHFSA